MKNNISYYSHDTNSHNNWKFKSLRKKFGWAGEGRFWALHNMIADAENCMLEISGAEKVNMIAADLDLTEDELKSFVEFLTTKCKLIQIENNKITTSRAQETLQGVTKKRNYQSEWKRLKSNIDLGNSSIENTFSNIETKKSIFENEQRKESKVNKKKVEKGFIPPSLEEVICFFRDNGYSEESGKSAFMYYKDGNWKDSKGNQVLSWKQKMRVVWFKPEHLIKQQNNLQPGDQKLKNLLGKA